MFRLVSLLSLVAFTSPALGQEAFNIEARGRLFVDVASYEEDFATLQASVADSTLRAARMGLQGGWDDFSFVAELDFGGDRASLKDVRLRWSGENTRVTLGNQKTPNSIEYLTSSTATSFMERAQPAQAFRYNRRIGVLVDHSGENYSVAVGVFGGAIGDSHSDFTISDSTVIAGRATFAPINEAGRILHLGVHARQYNRDAGEPESVRFRARPGASLADRYVDQRTTAESSTLIGVEALYINGPFHVLAELATEDAEGAADATAWGLSGGWVLTGESRVYRASDGLMRGVSPARSVSDGGWGAWEIAGRIDQLETESAGRQTSYTAGLNWQVERNVRVMANVILADVEGPARFGEGDFQGVEMRFQVTWP